MKLSSVAVLLSAAAALPGASAATVSLRGILPEAEELAAFANCDTKTDCGSYGPNSCDNIERDCDGQCFWNGNTCTSGGNRNCRNFNNRSSCERNNCEWDSSRWECRTPTNTSFRCSDYDNNSNRCENEGCSWVNSRCVLICSDFDFTSYDECEQSGLCTYSRSGHCDIRSCNDLDNTSRKECEDNTSNICRWNQNRNECDSNNAEQEKDFEEEEDVEAET